jgi:hypothetical protein
MLSKEAPNIYFIVLTFCNLIYQNKNVDIKFKRVSGIPSSGTFKVERVLNFGILAKK